MVKIWLITTKTVAKKLKSALTLLLSLRIRSTGGNMCNIHYAKFKKTMWSTRSTDIRSSSIRNKYRLDQPKYLFLMLLMMYNISRFPFFYVFTGILLHIYRLHLIPFNKEWVISWIMSLWTISHSSKLLYCVQWTILLKSNLFSISRQPDAT